jgi:hypothetical protein
VGSRRPTASGKQDKRIRSARTKASKIEEAVATATEASETAREASETAREASETARGAKEAQKRSSLPTLTDLKTAQSLFL